MRNENKKNEETKSVKLFADFFIAFAKIGSVAYGGGPSMVPIVKAEVVDRRHWVETEPFIDVLALGNTLPGPIVTKMAAAVGCMRGGLLGAVVSVVAIILPGSLALMALMGFVNVMKGNPMLESMLTGIRPVVVSMLAYAAWDMAPNAIKGKMTAAIFAAALLLMIFSPIHPAFIIIAGAVSGALIRL